MTGKNSYALWLVVILGLAGCRGSRLLNEYTTDDGKNNGKGQTLNSYFIPSVKGEIEGPGGEQEKFTAYVKCIVGKQMQLSIRGGAGIEGARAWISTDSLILLNRIDKMVSYSSLKKYTGNCQYGMIHDWIYSILTGKIHQYLEDKNWTEHQETGNEMTNATFHSGDCAARILFDKSGNITTQAFFTDKTNQLTINYSDFYTIEKERYPGRIDIQYGINKPYSLRLELKGMRVNEDISIGIKIPEQYEVMH